MRVLVIGGAEFIGSHLTDALIEQGHSVRVLDNLSPQVHVGCTSPDYLNHHAELFRGDVRNPESLRRAVEGTDAIFHLAGAVGVGDSMYRIRDYVEINTLGAANLLDILANQKHAVQKLILSSSATVYGEGKYRCPDHDIVFPEARSAEQFAAKDWNLSCPIQEREKNCSAALTPLPTDEKKPLSPQSVYAITKRNQEELFFATSQAYGIPVVVMRYFNVYGPRQALSNPYTGVVKIFGASLAQGRSPILYEDGLQSCDFVHVSDVARLESKTCLIGPRLVARCLRKRPSLNWSSEDSFPRLYQPRRMGKRIRPAGARSGSRTVQGFSKTYGQVDTGTKSRRICADD